MIAQIIIAIFGVAAVWLSQDERESHRKYACIFGLLGQPAWFYAAYTSEQWGIFALCFLYSFSWLRGYRQYWLLRKEKRQPGVSLDGYLHEWEAANPHIDLVQEALKRPSASFRNGDK